MMFTMAVPAFVTDSRFSVDASSQWRCSPCRRWALLANVAVAAYQLRTIIRRRRNPLTDRLYLGFRHFQQVVAQNHDLARSPGGVAHPQPATARS